MRTPRIRARLLCLFLLGVSFVLAKPAIAQQPRASAAPPPETVTSMRAKFNQILDTYEGLLRQMGSARGLQLIDSARQSMHAVADEQLAATFTNTGVPNLTDAVKTVENLGVLASRPPSKPATAAPRAAKPLSTSPPFPGAPPILGECNNIAHDSAFTFGALVAFQVLRTILAAAEFACGEVIAGFNGAAVCIPFAIAADLAEIPFELADFCGGEEDSALIQGSYDRLEHIHNDLADASTAILSAQTAIINNANTNTTNIINNANTNTTSIITNDNANRASIITNANTNTTNIINNSNANKDALVAELHALGCEIVRLLNTPDGQRSSSIFTCVGQPGFPYSWNKK